MFFRVRVVGIFNTFFKFRAFRNVSQKIRFSLVSCPKSSHCASIHYLTTGLHYFLVIVVGFETF